MQTALLVVLVVGAIVGITYVMNNTGIHDLDFTGTTFSSGSSTKSITVSPTVTSYKFRIRNASAYDQITTLRVGNIGGSVAPVAITLLKNTDTNYVATTTSTTATITSATVTADTVYYIQFASAVSSFDIIANPA